MGAAFEPAAFAGLGLVAGWLYVRFPARRPAGIARAMGHVVASFAFFMLLPVLLDAYHSVVGGTGANAFFMFAVLLPALCYVLLSWIWLLGGIAENLGAGTPRGGHPVPDGTR